MKLTLNDEEYSAQGQSIKKAQQQAALLALQQTNLKHPAPKNNDKTHKQLNSELSHFQIFRNETNIF